MGSLIEPVILRFLAYVFSSFALALPAWAAGLVIVHPELNEVWISPTTAATLIATAIASNLTIAAKWGIRVDPASVSPLILRLILFGVAPALAALPTSWSGFLRLDEATSMIVFSFGGLAMTATVALGGSAAVFAKWGVKR